MPADPEEFYTKGAEEFAENHRLDDRPGVKEKLEKFCKELEGNKVLDAGCGPVEEPDEFVERGFDYTGIDIAPGMIEYARENRKGDFHVMDMKDTDFQDERFDGVWCNASIFFVLPDEMREALQELARVLKTGGKLYINFKLGQGSFLKEKYGDEIRQYLVSEKKAREMLESAGFLIESFSKVDLSSCTLGEFFCTLEN
ncbi:MAG: class I SAM-dependent methyltransferase [Candidatus Nanosalina sp.]